MVGSGDTGVISREVSGVFGFIKKKVEYWAQYNIIHSLLQHIDIDD